MRFLLLVPALFLIGCGAPCEGTSYERDSQGNLKKYSQQSVNGQCLKDSVPLSRWESSLEARTKAVVTCTPQSLTNTLVAANNFYAYRNGKIYLDLDGSTGQYRRLTLAEGKDGKEVFTRLLGCFFVRDGQILLDTDKAASSQEFDPMEIFTYTASASAIEMVRFDDNGDGWDYRFCPYLDTPWGYCDLLKSPGNDMYFPVLTAAQQASLLQDALLIRKQFNYTSTSLATFNSLWDGQGRVENTREDYKYAVQAIVDTPRYIDQAWAQFIRGARPTMPDTTSARMPPICWSASQAITYPDGSIGKIYGQACYVNGQYVFTASP